MTRFIKPFLIACLLCLPIALNGCTAFGLATGAAATTGVAAAREGGIKQSVNDATIAISIKDRWFRYNVETFAKLNVTVNQGRVLVTGVVQDPKHRVEAIRLVWTIEGVKQVINEVQVADSEGVTGYVRDSWVSTRLRTQMTIDKEIQSLNYSIDTVQGVIYLMGVAQDQTELNRVIEIARTIPNAKQVVSYVKLAGVQE
ncbi:MAG: phospholipid-binding domain-containing protein [Micavibrio sp.]|nr:phospholipid-binding domain-containing protein [Micavibrio sp.]|tara:strand:+ start:1072 stop:1671 length:600 start_codon:yes stop_codon:yes gene_type:complete